MELYRKSKYHDNERKPKTMPNFDEIKRNATGAANRAMQKTNELTNIVKLKMSIKSSEGKLSSVYEEIGRLFYTAERNGEDCTSDIAAYIMKADKLKADIAAAKKQITKLKNEKICENCGNEIDEKVAFCPFCGQKQETITENVPTAEEPEEAPEKTFEDIVEETVETVENAASDAAEKAGDFIENFAENAEDKAEECAECVEDAVEEVKDAVEENDENN